MTDTELKDYLKEFLNFTDGVQNYIRALEFYKDNGLSPHLDRFTYRETVRQINEQITEAQEELMTRTATVKAWSYLIDNEDRRQIFVERYLKGDSWEDIADHHNYSEPHIFKINNYCCEEIALKTVCDLTASHDAKPEALSQYN